MAERPEPIGSFEHLHAQQARVRDETRQNEASLIQLLESLHSLYWECFGLLRGCPWEGDVEYAIFVVSTSAFMSLQSSLQLVELGYYVQAAVVVRLLLAEFLLCLAFRHSPECASVFLSEPGKRVPQIGTLLDRLSAARVPDDKIVIARSDVKLLHRHAHAAPLAVVPEVGAHEPAEGLWHYPRYDEERCRWVGARATVWGAAVLALLTEHFDVLSDDPLWTAKLSDFSSQLDLWHQQAIVRPEVLDALDEADAGGQQQVHVIIELRSPDSLEPAKETFAHLGVRTALRGTQRFLVAKLTRQEIEQVSLVAEHVGAVRLDRSVSAADS